mgnify:CR=1 FL=1
MKPKVLFIITVIVLAGNGCKSTSFKWQTTDKNEKILVGKIDRSQLLDKRTFPWFQTNYTNYNSAVNTDILYLKAFNQRVTFVVFAGTWCDDTQNLLPKFYRVIDEARFQATAVTLYAVDRNKKSLKGEAETNQITNVPTFIVYKDGKEIGRIVESVKKSIELDLKEMLVAVNK